MSERVDRWRAQASVGVGSLITSYPGLIHLVNICPGTAIESPCSSIGGSYPSLVGHNSSPHPAISISRAAV
ncbi:unnamed protein product, partial [Ascophyllum nodosum]